MSQDVHNWLMWQSHAALTPRDSSSSVATQKPRRRRPSRAAGGSGRGSGTTHASEEPCSAVASPEVREQPRAALAPGGELPLNDSIFEAIDRTPREHFFAEDSANL